MAHKNAVNLGVKESTVFGLEPTSPGKRKDKMIFPGFSMHKDVGIKESDVGKTIPAIVMLKVIEVSKEATEKGKKEGSRVEVVEINTKPKISHYRTN